MLSRVVAGLAGSSFPLAKLCIAGQEFADDGMTNFNRLYMYVYNLRQILIVKLAYQSVSQSVVWSVNQSISQLVTYLVKQSADVHVCLSIGGFIFYTMKVGSLVYLCMFSYRC